MFQQLSEFRVDLRLPSVEHDLRVPISRLAFPPVAYLSTMPYKKNISSGSGPDAIRSNCSLASVGRELQCDARLPLRLYFLC